MIKTQPLHIDAVVVGGGHAGLSVSRCLSDREIDHVILEKAEVANSWKTERWDSLRLLTPNWQSQLPGFSYKGGDPHGFMSRSEVVDFIERYADVVSAPIEINTKVKSVCSRGDSYELETNRGLYKCRSVVLATGACNIANIPELSKSIPTSVNTITPINYQTPDQLTEGGVLVVGASATGIQLAYEIHKSGRPVTLSVGEHVRIPRTYRGRDVFWWMDATSISDECYTDVDDINRARSLPSPQLTGSLKNTLFDLNYLRTLGIKIMGRLVGINNSQIQFSGSLKNTCMLADLKMNRLLNTIDEWISTKSWDNGIEPPHRFPSTIVETSPTLSLDFYKNNIRTIVWATGFYPDYSWLKIPVLDRKGRIRHDGGITESPGLYLLGLNFLRRRKSSFIHGAQDDARDISTHLRNYLWRQS